MLRSIETGSAAIIIMNRTTMRREQRAFALLLLDRACTGRSDPRSARNRYAAAGAFSVHDRSNDQVARSFLALTSVNAFVTGRHKLRPMELCRRQSDGYRFGRLRDGHCCKCASCDADRNGSDHFKGE